MRAADEPGDRGSATIAVTLFGGLAVLIGISLAGRMVTEYRAVEDSLTQTRAYWAAMGQATYVLSRTMESGGTTDNAIGETSLVPTEQSYLNEIATGPNSLQTWMYPDISANYQFTVHSMVCSDPLAPATHVGDLIMMFSFSGPATCPTAPPLLGSPPACPKPAPSAPNTPDALRTISMTRPVEVRYCVVQASSDTCAAADLQKQAGAYQFITSIHRPTC